MLLIGTLHKLAIFSRLGSIIAVSGRNFAVFHLDVGLENAWPGAGDEPVTHMFNKYLRQASSPLSMSSTILTDTYVARY